MKAVIEEMGILITITSLSNLCRFQKHLACLCSSKRPGQHKKCPTLEIFVKCTINQNRVYVNNGILLDGVLSMTGREIHLIDSQTRIHGLNDMCNVKNQISELVEFIQATEQVK